MLALGWLAVATLVLTAGAATGPGLTVVDALLAHVPGTGLLRDTQKFLALAVPFYALAAADIIRALNMRKEDAPRVHQPVTDESGRGGWLRKTKGSWI